MKFVTGKSRVAAAVFPPISPQQLGTNLSALLKAAGNGGLLDLFSDATGELYLRDYLVSEGGTALWGITLRINLEQFGRMPAVFKQEVEELLSRQVSRLFEEFPEHRVARVQVAPLLLPATETEPAVEAYDPVKGFATPEDFYLARELEVLGDPERGGFARVVRARRRHLDIEVAIKFFDPHPLAVDTAERRDKARNRLIREGGLLASIRHPNVVRLQDYTLVAGDPVLVLEYIQGRTLDALRQERGPLPFTEAVGYVGQVLDALATCHDRGIIHRDVAPKNVVVEAGGRAVLIDFGLGVSEEFRAGTRLTTQPMGTPGFKAPELEDDPLRAHPTVDIFSTGALLAFLLTGRPPRLGFPPALPDAGTAFTQLVSRTLDLDPDKRPSSARGLRDELLAFIQPATSSVAASTDVGLLDPDVVEALGIRSSTPRDDNLGAFIHHLRVAVQSLAGHPHQAAGLATLLTAARTHLDTLLPIKQPESRRETKKLERAMSRVLAILSGSLQAPPPAQVAQSFAQAMSHGWLTQGTYDAWAPGMESGTGWRNIYSATSLGLRWLKHHARFHPTAVTDASAPGTSRS
ncbi:serine/threonine protein kinase [Myxococcus stipitatus]|uniref:serine/threonine-protein kinase n=1 Tax=Myxococcus stipitatus TaxID=83455 RepID=UPI001F2024DD|nr:serine/threonine-protein kinase [Myxococcus stipitatus]MCE9673870.1 serine/threonine protein kinase [Myxococcus stipitatus]